MFITFHIAFCNLFWFTWLVSHQIKVQFCVRLNCVFIWLWCVCTRYLKSIRSSGWGVEWHGNHDVIEFQGVIGFSVTSCTKNTVKQPFMEAFCPGFWMNCVKLGLVVAVVFCVCLCGRFLLPVILKEAVWCVMSIFPFTNVTLSMQYTIPKSHAWEESFWGKFLLMVLQNV